jgi:hypothetical protein
MGEQSGVVSGTAMAIRGSVDVERYFIQGRAADWADRGAVA